MKNSAVKFLIAASLALNVGAANAVIYKISLTYDSDTDGDPGSLSGFIMIDSALFDGNQNNTNTSSINSTIPSWITAINLTVSGRTGSDAPANGSYTTTDFTVGGRMAFTIKDDGNDFDPSQNFKNQMVRFGFDTASGRFGLPSIDNPLDQEAAGGEFPLLSSVTTPGELPILGFGALIYYFKKFKNKSFKL